MRTSLEAVQQALSRALPHEVSLLPRELGIVLDRLCSNDEVFDRVHMAARGASDALLAWHRTNQVGLRRVG